MCQKELNLTEIVMTDFNEAVKNVTVIDVNTKKFAAIDVKIKNVTLIIS